MTTASVIISSYNYAPFLRQAIDSALAQSDRQVEVIVVDDGSTDDSPSIIQSYGACVRPILKSNAGQASSLNAGFAASRGDAIIFLDSDDALEPNAVERAIELLDHSASKVHWPLRKINSSGERLDQLEPCAELSHGNLRDVVLQHGPRSDGYLWPPTSGNAWSRRFLERVMPMPETAYRTCPDLYLCGLAPLYGTVASLAQPLSLWRVHGENNTWKQSLLPRVAQYVKLWDDCCADLERHARRLGLTPHPEQWRHQAWWHRLQRAANELCQSIPRDAKFILIDDEQWACRDLDGRAVLPLLTVGGAPADDAQAIHALESRIADGAQYLVFAWSAFWWIEHYTGFIDHLRSRFRCAPETADLVVFNLRNGDRTND